MKYKRLLAFALSVVITSNTILPAFANENVIADMRQNEEVATQEPNDKDDFKEDVLVVPESRNDETLERNSANITENSVISISDDDLCETEDLMWSIDDNFVLTISGNGNMQGESEGDYPWYEYALEVTEIVIEEGITSVGNSAFESFSSLEKVTLSNSVVSIGESAFKWCDILSEINFPPHLKYIGEYAFSECANLNNVELPEMLLAIEDCAFEYCISLEKITIPASTKSIGIGCFSGCSGLKEATILSDELTELKMDLFWGCTELKTVKIPKNIMVIQQGVIQLAEHPALDQSYEGFMKALEDGGFVVDTNLKVDYKNAQGEVSNCETIATKFVNDKVDLMLAIATNAAQACANATDTIPVVLTAVTDPEHSGCLSIDEEGTR